MELLRWLVHKIRRISESIHFCTRKGYNEELYWENIHHRYNSDFRAVGGGPSDAHNGRYPQQKKELLQFLNKLRFNVEKAACIEFGCGNGYWGRMFLEEGAQQYVGVDVSKTAIRNCKKSVPTGIFKRLNLGKSDYDLEVQGDLVFSIDVVQHFVEEMKLEKFLENMVKAVKPAGLIILTSYTGFGDTYSDSQEEIRLLGFFKLPKFRYVHFWDIQTVQKHLQHRPLIAMEKFWDKTILAFRGS